MKVVRVRPPLVLCLDCKVDVPVIGAAVVASAVCATVSGVAPVTAASAQPATSTHIVASRSSFHVLALGCMLPLPRLLLLPLLLLLLLMLLLLPCLCLGLALMAGCHVPTTLAGVRV